MKVKYLLRLTLFAAAVLAFAACSKEKNNGVDETPDGPQIEAAQKHVSTFQIVQVLAKGNVAPKYTGSFDEVPVELIKSSDTTLAFVVPDVNPGTAILKIGSSTLDFTVSKTPETGVTEFTEFITNRYSADIASLPSATPEQIEQIEEIKALKDEVLNLFNSLSADLKRQTVMIYEANKEVFQNFRSAMITDYDAPIVFGLQSGCPRTDFNSYYSCTASNLAASALQLRDASKAFLGMVMVAGISAYMAPASLGVALVGASLSMGVAAMLFVVDILPAVKTFMNATGEFLGANWIFTKALFGSITDLVFKDQINTDLGLKPAFRTINENDGPVNEGTGRFISAMNQLSGYWEKMESAFGKFPGFRNQESATTLTTGEVTVSNISNPKVQYLGNQGQAVRFKSLSGNEESFSFHVKVIKEGFSEEKTLNGTVVPLPDSTAIFEQACVGNWTVTNVESGTSYQMTLNAGGSGIYHPSNIAIRWEIVKSAGKYYLYEYNFWNSGFNQFRVINTGLPNESLTYPVTGFIHYGKLGNNPINASLQYTKN